VNGAFWAVLGFALYFKVSWATSLWPWPEVGMSYVFLASIMAAIAAPSIWIGLTGEFAAFAGVGINTMFVNIGVGAYLIWRAYRWNEALAGPIAVSVAAFVLGAVFFLWSRRLPVRDPRPMPPIVRWSFVGFALILIVAGGALGLQFERIFPWDLQPQSSTIFGLIFLGAATYFLHAIAHPRWVFGAGPLWAFLAYDIVLFGPYLRMLGGSPADSAAFADDYGAASGGGVNMTSLTIYLTVLAVSTLLALYMICVHPDTRLIRPRTPGA
jgi:uncharacterized membrane protein YqjE